MIASRRNGLKLTLYLGFAALAAIGSWLAILLLSQLALMEPVTAPGVQSLADNGDALIFLASGDAGAHYASARWWVWFCICTNGAGAVLIGLWLRATLSPLTAPVRRKQATAAAARGDLIERAMQGRSRAGASTPRPLPAPAPEAGSRHSLAAGAPADARPESAAASAASAASPAPAAPAASAANDASLRLARVARIIDNLAFQTTLLAVNAAVEAERGSRLPPRA